MHITPVAVKIEAMQALPEIRVREKAYIVVVVIGPCPMHLVRSNCTLKCEFNIWRGWLSHVRTYSWCLRRMNRKT